MKKLYGSKLVGRCYFALRLDLHWSPEKENWRFIPVAREGFVVNLERG